MSASVITFCTGQIYHRRQRIIETKFTTVSVRPSSSHDTQTIENLLKTENTKLSNEIWKLKEQNKNVDISWEILGIRLSYNTATKRCILPLNEKLAIALHKQDNILNKRTKIITKCRRSNKYNLANYDTKD